MYMQLQLYSISCTMLYSKVNVHQIECDESSLEESGTHIYMSGIIHVHNEIRLY